jgi:hypothetical protein
MPTPEGMEPSAYPRPHRPTYTYPVGISQATDPVSARHFFVLLISLRHGHPPTALRPLQLHRGTQTIFLRLLISTNSPWMCQHPQKETTASLHHSCARQGCRLEPPPRFLLNAHPNSRWSVIPRSARERPSNSSPAWREARLWTVPPWSEWIAERNELLKPAPWGRASQPSNRFGAVVCQESHLSR